ncbi:MAG: hypothetical protein LBC39_02685 [Methanobrevibacter sp.]|jgi:uncharacterized membrane-anchored protein|nr:hypothetical protein [Candidatus Methanovirga aequatorialis]
MVELKELMQLIVLCSLILFAGFILVISYFIPAEFNQEMFTILNLIIGALIGIVSVKGNDIINKK